jgi:hypothetical protein
MSQSTKYFAIPFDNVPKDPTYTVWFATWSTERPAVEPGTYPPWVVGVTEDDVLPAGATLLGTCSKDPPPPPPPAAPVSMADYQTSVSNWLETTKLP